MNDAEPARCYTDNPDTTQSFLPSGWHWSPQEPAVADQRLWATFSDRPVWRATASAAIAAPWPMDRETPVVLIDHAARSQFDRAIQAIQAGTPLPERYLCLALEGRGFHGQRGRSWQALRGNLHLTAQFSLDLDLREGAPALTALPAVAAARAIRTASNHRARVGIKWVNDLLLDDHKIGGVLTWTDLCAGRVRRVLFGIGINIAQAPTLPTAPYIMPAASLSAYGLQEEHVFSEIAKELHQGLQTLRHKDGAPRLLRQYQELNQTVGRPVTIWPEDIDDPQTDPAPIRTGTVDGIHPDLTLQLAGQPEPVRTGRLTLERAVPSRGTRANPSA